VGLRVVWMSRPDVRQWPVNDVPAGLSVNESTHNLLVTCDEVRTIKEFSADGKVRSGAFQFAIRFVMRIDSNRFVL